jgi:hypothetical protein
VSADALLLEREPDAVRVVHVETATLQTVDEALPIVVSPALRVGLHEVGKLDPNSIPSGSRHGASWFLVDQHLDEISHPLRERSRGCSPERSLERCGTSGRCLSDDGNVKDYTGFMDSSPAAPPAIAAQSS